MPRKHYLGFAVVCCFVFVLCPTDPARSQNAGLLPPPTGQMCELMAHPENSPILDAHPEFSWIMNSTLQNDYQTAYQVLIASDQNHLRQNRGDIWDSGKVLTGQSVSITYPGQALRSKSDYYWKVRLWNRDDRPSSYSRPQHFRTGNLSGKYQTVRYRLCKDKIRPVRLVQTGTGKFFLDFGRDAFGTIMLKLTNPGTARIIKIHLGEVPAGNNAINRQPGGSRRYRVITLQVEPASHTYILSIPPDKRNTGPHAIKMPSYIGEVMPFRYCEIENWPYQLAKDQVFQLAVHYPFNDDASSFHSSNGVLNDIWNLCKYSIKATSFSGVYVDGDRERIPYEADAYINQMGHYCTDREFTLARYSHEYLINHPTWPTEWIMHSVMIAWTDYFYTADTDSLRHYYNDLKAKTLIALQREDGLISVSSNRVTAALLEAIHLKGKLRDLVDWPHGGILGLKEGGYGETDGYVFKPFNTVVNAFHYHSLVLMAKIAATLDKKADAEHFAAAARRVRHSFNKIFLDRKKGIYVDGEGTTHSSLHANMFALAFDLVPPEYQNSVGEFIESRGMACSVYGAQYLLEALYQANMPDYALELLTARDERGWAHMIYDVGTTITLEAWDNKYKPNQDWNHAWGTAPANIIPRFLMGVRPLEPGYKKALIQPQPGPLKYASLKLPTIRGPVQVAFTNNRQQFKLNITIPANMTAKLMLPRMDRNDAVLTIDNQQRRGVLQGEFVVLNNVGSGKHEIIRSR